MQAKINTVHHYRHSALRSKGMLQRIQLDCAHSHCAVQPVKYDEDEAIR